MIVGGIKIPEGVSEAFARFGIDEDLFSPEWVDGRLREADLDPEQLTIEEVVTAVKVLKFISDGVLKYGWTGDEFRHNIIDLQEALGWKAGSLIESESDISSE